MRAFRRLRWVLPALVIPACAAAVGVALQAAAFGRAPEDSLVATQVLRQLVRYKVMRGTETLDGKTVGSSCVQGWFKIPHRHRLVPGAIVLLSNGVRLYDVGHGVHRLARGGRWHGVHPTLEQRVQFVLAACPRYLGDRLATDLVHGKALEMINRRADAAEAAALVVGAPRARLTLEVTRVTHRPLVLLFRYGRLSGQTVLRPGGGGAEVWRVRHAFNLPLHPSGLRVRPQRFNA